MRQDIYVCGVDSIGHQIQVKNKKINKKAKRVKRGGGKDCLMDKIPPPF